METKNFSTQSSVSSSTVTEIQKERIIEAILQSIKVSSYYEGLELKACKAISNINKYSDSEIIEEIIDRENGALYRKINSL
ncbi:hypothetical protein BKG95_02500 [Rodentibacter pneumotropicus]|uniref:Uncharacterized protein n=1 Tax=Rodentibacter pneumotropicus TaxID=758 RepID=A0AAW5LC81_9PAST|nr:hypothetical protein [Rodentibacter pneumotropicus]MCQ9120986.1 hypothetical protein [Rodentibacter pneumotropicus]OOF69155.1 hypothetical protein BKG95_02500 [Rodentibacter pneumotropicus]